MSKYQHYRLQEACDSINGLIVERYWEPAGHKTVNKFFVTFNDRQISPVLDFLNLLHFILGIIRSKECIGANNPIKENIERVISDK